MEKGNLRKSKQIQCGVDGIRIVNVTDGYRIMEEMRGIVSSLYKHSETVNKRIEQLLAEPLEPDRYVWLSVDSINRITGLSFTLMDEFEGKIPDTTFEKEDIESSYISFNITILVSVLMTKLYQEQDGTLLDVARTILYRRHHIN